MRTSEQKVHPLLKNQIIDMLSQTLADIKNKDEGRLFLENFMTESEYETFAKRLAIAYWLKKGRSYTNIKENLKVSSATIAAVQNMMTQKGFQEALRRIEAEEWATEWTEKIKKFVKK